MTARTRSCLVLAAVGLILICSSLAATIPNPPTQRTVHLRYVDDTLPRTAP